MALLRCWLTIAFGHFGGLAKIFIKHWKHWWPNIRWYTTADLKKTSKQNKDTDLAKLKCCVWPGLLNQGRPAISGMDGGCDDDRDEGVCYFARVKVLKYLEGNVQDYKSTIFNAIILYNFGCDVKRLCLRPTPCCLVWREWWSLLYEGTSSSLCRPSLGKDCSIKIVCENNYNEDQQSFCSEQWHIAYYRGILQSTRWSHKGSSALASETQLSRWA